MKLFFLVVLNVVVDLIGELEVSVEVTAVGVFGVGEDGEVLLGLPLEDAVALGWVVVAAFDLAEHEESLVVREVFVKGEVAEDFFVGEEVAGDHGEDEAAVVADIFADLEGVEEVGHHGVFAELGDAFRGGRRLFEGRCRACSAGGLFGFEFGEFGLGGFGTLGGVAEGFRLLVDDFGLIQDYLSFAHVCHLLCGMNDSLFLRFL